MSSNRKFDVILGPKLSLIKFLYATLIKIVSSLLSNSRLHVLLLSILISQSTISLVFVDRTTALLDNVFFFLATIAFYRIVLNAPFLGGTKTVNTNVNIVNAHR
ncbi:hypothetical protein BY458DRAFT_83436 [Sporodiniella umbellata]|nr:hypothetical protein BY458DRAFT_83436 [Sporodiniella umbellata]